MEEMVICQSCSMPLVEDNEKGTNANGGKSEEYCIYCFVNGKFTKPDQTLEEAIAESEDYADMAGMTKEEARKHAEETLPKLKRWKKG